MSTTYTTTPVMMRLAEDGSYVMGDGSPRSIPLGVRLTEDEYCWIKKEADTFKLSLSAYAAAVLNTGYPLQQWDSVLEADSRAFEDAMSTLNRMRATLRTQENLLSQYSTTLSRTHASDTRSLERYRESVMRYIASMDAETEQARRLITIRVYVDSFTALSLTHHAAEINMAPTVFLRCLLLGVSPGSPGVVSRKKKRDFFVALRGVIKRGGFKQVPVTHVVKNCARCRTLPKASIAPRRAALPIRPSMPITAERDIYKLPPIPSSISEKWEAMRAAVR